MDNLLDTDYICHFRNVFVPCDSKIKASTVKRAATARVSAKTQFHHCRYILLSGFFFIRLPNLNTFIRVILFSYVCIDWLILVLQKTWDGGWVLEYAILWYAQAPSITLWFSLPPLLIFFTFYLLSIELRWYLIGIIISCNRILGLSLLIWFCVYCFALCLWFWIYLLLQTPKKLSINHFLTNIYRIIYCPFGYPCFLKIDSNNLYINVEPLMQKVYIYLMSLKLH